MAEKEIDQDLIVRGLELLTKIHAGIVGLPVALGITGAAVGTLLGVGEGSQALAEPGEPTGTPGEVPEGLLDAFEASAVGMMTELTESLTEAVQRLTDEAISKLNETGEVGGAAGPAEEFDPVEGEGETTPIIDAVVDHVEELQAAQEQEVEDSKLKLVPEDGPDQAESLDMAAGAESLHIDKIAEEKYGIEPEPDETEELPPLLEPPEPPEPIQGSTSEISPEPESTLPQGMLDTPIIDAVVDHVEELQAAQEQEVEDSKLKLVPEDEPDQAESLDMIDMEDDDPDHVPDLGKTIEDIAAGGSPSPISDAQAIMAERAEEEDDLSKTIEDIAAGDSIIPDESEDEGDGMEETNSILREILEKVGDDSDEDGGGEDNGSEGGEGGAGSSGGKGGKGMNMQRLAGSAKFVSMGAAAAAALVASSALADDKQRGGGIRSLDAIKSEAQEAANAPRGKVNTLGRLFVEPGWTAISRIDTGAIFNSFNRVI